MPKLAKIYKFLTKIKINFSYIRGVWVCVVAGSSPVIPTKNRATFQLPCSYILHNGLLRQCYAEQVAVCVLAQDYILHLFYHFGVL